MVRTQSVARGARGELRTLDIHLQALSSLVASDAGGILQPGCLVRVGGRGNRGRMAGALGEHAPGEHT